MPQERQHDYPFPTAADAENAPGDRADKAARNIVSRRIDGIPKRGYIMGDCDHAPVVKGVRDFTEVVIALLDKLDPEPDAPNPNCSKETLGLIENVRVMMEDHRCPTSAES